MVAAEGVPKASNDILTLGDGTRLQAVIVKKREEEEEGPGHTVTLIGGKVFGGKLNQAGDWIWNEPSR